ncbi:hypothetical protein ENH_00034540 [Eimeria necatrix]|uniref:Uncharacterized protein n=1 Tax=Eimeria necatrix TaxID=51315 RepID=U6MXS9_9EIME|nr:hypothetical protein ENH_00034540 [Eimeria necatrix]CDJ67319.1 hypothetical protein ENH_00034540 [Eimeria necatrix]
MRLHQLLRADGAKLLSKQALLSSEVASSMMALDFSSCSHSAHPFVCAIDCEDGVRFYKQAILWKMPTTLKEQEQKKHLQEEGPHESLQESPNLKAQQQQQPQRLQQKLHSHVTGLRILEIGCGPLALLSLLAVQQGAAQVDAVESLTGRRWVSVSRSSYTFSGEVLPQNGCSETFGPIVIDFDEQACCVQPTNWPFTRKQGLEEFARACCSVCAKAIADAIEPCQAKFVSSIM